jgi:choline dehydrogenase-like flavoprotein
MKFYTAHDRPDREFTGALVLAPAILDSEKLLQASFTFKPPAPPKTAVGAEARAVPAAWRGESELARLAAPLAGLLADLTPGGSAVLTQGATPTVYRVTYRGEQLPNPESRITLSKHKDALGMPRVRLRWLLEQRDLTNIVRAVELLGSALSAPGLGRIGLQRELGQPEGAKFIRGGNHHMGTTRMASDPKRGVVDADCRVHGVSNLWIAGSSVYPTSGSANPTLTLIALAMRLAEHIEGALA